MHCNSCGGSVDGLSNGGTGRCSTCHRLFSLENGQLSEIRVEPPPGIPKAEFTAIFLAQLGVAPAAPPPRGMRNFAILTMESDERALELRRDRTRESGARTYDMVRAAYACPRCNRSTPPPVPLIPTRAPYRSLSEVAAALHTLVEAGARAGRAIPACSCGTAPLLAQVDQHVFCSLTGSDIVVRGRSGIAPELLSWSPEAGYGPIAPSSQLDQAVAADAILRTLDGLRDSFDESEDFESFAMVFQEGTGASPANAALLEYAPFLMKNGGDQLVEAMASAHVQAAPNSAVGYYWKAQVAIERSARSGGGDARANAEAMSLLNRAVALKPDYPNALIGLANLARLARDDAKAEATLRSLLASHPDHPEGNYTLGLILLAKDPAGALVCFERGERVAPRDADYPRSRARALLALKRVPEAKLAIQRAKTLAPNDPRIEQLASEMRGNNPIATAMKWGVRGVILSILVGGGLYAYATVKSATRDLTAIPGVAPSATPAMAAVPSPSAAVAKPSVTGAKHK